MKELYAEPNRIGIHGSPPSARLSDDLSGRRSDASPNSEVACVQSVLVVSSDCGGLMQRVELDATKLGWKLGTIEINCLKNKM